MKSSPKPQNRSRPTKLSRIISRDQSNLRLDDFLAVWLPEALGSAVSRATVRKLIAGGAVYVSSRRMTQPAYLVREGSRVEAFVDVGRLKPDSLQKDRPFAFAASRILFEDEGLIAVDKPPGLPTQPTLDPLRPHLFGLLQEFMRNRDGAQAYVGLHHRLDRDTSGVVLFTKRTEANAGVATLFTQHLAQKTYWALALVEKGSPLRQKKAGDEWVIQNLLGKDPRVSTGKKSRYASVKTGGDFAHTDFKILECWGDLALVEARPKTGRTHQIRVHLSEQGAPILGDDTYGVDAPAPSFEVPRLLLHAACLKFPHPISKVETSISSPIPEDFQKCLNQFRVNQK